MTFIAINERQRSSVVTLPSETRGKAMVYVHEHSNECALSELDPTAPLRRT